MYLNQQINKRPNCKAAILAGAFGFFGAFFISGFDVSEVVVVNTKADLERFHAANPQWILVSRDKNAMPLNDQNAGSSAPATLAPEFSPPETSVWRVSHLSVIKEIGQPVSDFDFGIGADNHAAAEWQPKLLLCDRTPARPFAMPVQQPVID